MRGFESGVASFLKKLDSSRSSLSTQELSTALRQSVANRAMRFGGSATSQRVIKTDVPSKVFAQQEPPSPPTPSTPGLDLTGMLSQWLSSPGGPPPQSAKASTVGEQERVEKSTLTSDNSRWVEPRQQRRGDYETPRPNFSDSEDTLARLGEDFSPATPLTPLFASQLQASRPRQMEIEALEENQSPPRSRRPSPTPLPQPSSRVAAANGTGSHGEWQKLFASRIAGVEQSFITGHYSPVQTGSTAGMSAQAGTPEAANSRIYSSMAAPTPAPGTSSMTSAQLPSLPYMQGGAPPSFVPLTHTTGKTQHEPLWGQASVQAQPSDQCSESESGSSVQQKPQMSGGHQRRAPKPQKRKTKKAAIPRSKPRLHKFAAGHSSKGPEVPRRITNLGHPPAETQTTSQKPAAAALSNPSQPRHSPSTVQQPSEQPVPTVLPRHSEPVTDDESNASVATPWDDSPAASWWELQQVGGPGPHQSAANNHPTAHRVSPTATPSSPYPAPESVVAYLQSQIDKLNERFLQQTREFHNLYEKVRFFTAHAGGCYFQLGNPPLSWSDRTKRTSSGRCCGGKRPPPSTGAHCSLNSRGTLVTWFSVSATSIIGAERKQRGRVYNFQVSD